MKTRRIKIVSDGTRHGTKVVDAESGDLVADVMEVRWEAKPSDGFAGIATLTVFAPEIEVEADAVSVPWPAPIEGQAKELGY